MSMPPPPRPAHRGPGPQPPGRAQALVARSGFVVYEGGTNIFNESVLVNLARSGDWRPNYDVVDHVGRALGAISYPAGRGWSPSRKPIEVFDPGGARLLLIQPNSRIFGHRFDISGVASGAFVAPPVNPNMVRIEANNEPFGSINGRGLRGLSGPHLFIRDQDDKPVGAIRTFRQGGLFSQAENYVISLTPGLRGELRRLIIAAPAVLAVMRRAQQAAG